MTSYSKGFKYQKLMINVFNLKKIWNIYLRNTCLCFSCHFKKPKKVHVHILVVAFTLAVLRAARSFGPGALFVSAG